MLIGAMNHPAEDVISEIKWMAALGLEFVDLTFEPPKAAVWNVNTREIRDALADHGLPAVGHTAYYLPMGSPFESLRRAAVDEFKRCLERFAEVGVEWMNIHPDGKAPLHPDNYHVGRNLQSLEELLPFAREVGVGLMLENLPGKFNTVAQISPVLDALPELALHLDIGHCNLITETNTGDDLIRTYSHRLKHVHLHDNKGGNADLHLPLGCGTIDIAHYVRLLQTRGYDSTITLEVFADDRTYLAHSRDILRKLWDEPEMEIPSTPATPRSKTN
ncbi:MAG: sugar phosphate isomerase/epimerase [Verrucomicrobia bacterium]|nr:sugar phosphate isomerase/epimerase [Verrucomicrobiota bacterium]